MLVCIHKMRAWRVGYPLVYPFMACTIVSTPMGRSRTGQISVSALALRFVVERCNSEMDKPYSMFFTKSLCEATKLRR